MNGTMVKINSSFVSEKIQKIRFVDEKNSEEPDSFITGSENVNFNLKLWRLTKNKFSEDEEHEYVPTVASKLTLDGEITGVEFLDCNNFAVSTSTGNVSLIYMNKDKERDNIRENYRFDDLHRFSTGETAACTGISIHDENIASVGEDGNVFVMNANTQKIVHKYENADSIAQTVVKFVSYQELLTGNRLGMLKSFDLRSGATDAATTFMVSCQDEKRANAVTALTHHPTQKHIILAGSEEGSITVWDLRQPAYPASYLCAHEFGITEIKFHQTQPTKLFTASLTGELWKWEQNQQIIPQEYETNNKNPLDSVNPWLNGERAKNKINISTVLTGLRKSINTFDVSRKSRVICACNNEAIYLLDNVY